MATSSVGGEPTSSQLPLVNPLRPPMETGCETGLGVAARGSTSLRRAEGRTLLFSTYLGGSNIDRVTGLKVDPSGNVYVIGRTKSTNFPTVQPLQATYGGGAFDAFVTEIDGSGSTILFSTFLGGSGDDEPTAVALDAVGNVYVSGSTSSVDFPIVGGFQTQYGGGALDAFVAEIGLCNYALSPPSSVLLGLGGGSGSFNFTTGPECNWTATTTSTWITITSPAAGSGSGVSVCLVAPNATAVGGAIPSAIRISRSWNPDR